MPININKSNFICHLVSHNIVTHALTSSSGMHFSKKNSSSRLLRRVWWLLYEYFSTQVRQIRGFKWRFHATPLNFSSLCFMRTSNQFWFVGIDLRNFYYPTPCIHFTYAIYIFSSFLNGSIGWLFSIRWKQFSLMQYCVMHLHKCTYASSVNCSYPQCTRILCQSSITHWTAKCSPLLNHLECVCCLSFGNC